MGVDVGSNRKSIGGWGLGPYDKEEALTTTRYI